MKAFILGATLMLSAPLVLSAHAQTAAPQMLITWRTVNGTAPAGYQGKILPKTGSLITASVDVLTASGKFADLSGQTIYWYLDDNYIGGGVGKQSITFTAPQHTEIMALRANIQNYAGGTLINTAHIRMTDPQIVIIAPYPGKFFSGNSVEVTAFPYFFSAAGVSKLNYQWSVNGQSVTTQENPLDLVVNLNGAVPAGYSLAISLATAQSDDPFTTAASNITLTEGGQ